jgi:hypothetical protein
MLKLRKDMKVCALALYFSFSLTHILAFENLTAELFLDEDREVVMEDLYLCFKNTADLKFFNVAVFKYRMRITFEMFLTDANIRGKLHGFDLT